MLVVGLVPSVEAGPALVCPANAKFLRFARTAAAYVFLCALAIETAEEGVLGCRCRLAADRPEDRVEGFARESAGT